MLVLTLIYLLQPDAIKNLTSGRNVTVLAAFSEHLIKCTHNTYQLPFHSGIYE